MSKSLVVLLIAFVVVADGCQSKDAGRALQTNFQAPSSFPKMLAVYMPWFGNRSHIDVGYSSNDPEVLSRQIDEAVKRGIAAFVVDWNGPRGAYTDSNFALLQQIAKEKRFKVALLLNEDEEDNGQATEDAIAAFDKAYKSYIGPDARAREAYLTYNGRPLIFIFPKGGHTDWNRVSNYVKSWAAPPLIIYKDAPPPQYAGAFDGYYPWVHPSGKWAGDGSDWGKDYLHSFYKRMKNEYKDKIAIGAAWPGFDDSKASWGLNRHMDARCGKTLDETLQIPREYFDDSNPMPFMLIETWNDYEEGTAVERETFQNCSAQTSGKN